MKKLLVLLSLVFLLAACADDQPNEKVKEEESTQSEESVSGEETATEPAPEPKPEPEQEKVSREFQQALKTAQNYLNTMAFSEKALYNQLVSEYGNQFPEDAAQYAIENVEVDYNEQALKAAENYLSIMPMSDKELYNQLTSEHGDQYTAEQAQYAMDNLSE